MEHAKRLRAVEAAAGAAAEGAVAADPAEDLPQSPPSTGITRPTAAEGPRASCHRARTAAVGTLKLKFPWKLGEVVQKVALARFSRTYSALIAAGVPMLQAIDITGRTSGNKVMENAMGRVLESVKRGGPIAAPMRESPEAFPVMVTQMIAVGEETGALDKMFSKIADFYDDQVAAALKALTSILEPLLIIFVGAIVGSVVIAMYLPLFEVYDNIR
jgi:type IV pilus assembly protein PilC